MKIVIAIMLFTLVVALLVLIGLLGVVVVDMAVDVIERVRYEKMKKSRRNIDRIRKMNTKQLATLLDGGADMYCPHTTDGSVYCKEMSCEKCIEDWLVEEKR